MTDEEIFQILKKHVLGYTPELARHPYGWMTAVIDAQQEIIQKVSIGFFKWFMESNFVASDDDGQLFVDRYDETEATLTYELLYQEYLKSLQ